MEVPFLCGRAFLPLHSQVLKRNERCHSLPPPQDITHVLNFDFPMDIDEYVHRVGRTGRAGRTGCAMSFIGREDWRKAGDLIPIMQEAGQEVPK